ncbi:MAG TPA: CRTAC1 family protein [Woeseiaceae bacterium]|nr:CRTAC1 family protein [Woeseiaceae bacterium]
MLRILVACTSITVFQVASGEAIRFEDVTTRVIESSCRAKNPFDFDFMDANADGLYDVFAYSHLGVEHCLYVQKRDGSGTFGYVSGSEANYRQEKVPPRGSSRAGFIDLDGDGFEEITTTEADILAAVFPNETSGVGATPRYGTKQAWCAAKDQCTVGDLDGDGRMEKIRGDRSIETIVSGASFAPAAGPRAASGWYVVDLDGDSWPDLVDVAAGGYWRNVRGDLSWQAVPGFAPCTFGRHQDFADFDNDGDLDIACASGAANVKNTGGSRHLLRNDGGSRFTEVTAGSGFEQLAWLPYYSSYSNSYAADFDNDGLVDYVTSGSSYRLGAQVLRNVGGLKFQLQTLEFAGQFANGGGKPRVDVADYDHDGWLDLLTGQDAAPSVRVYRNVTGGPGNWLGLRLRGAGDNTGGLHATVRVYRAGGEELLGSFQVLNHPDGQMHDVHAGLGDTRQVDVQITWPHAGGVEWLRGIDANQTVHVTYRPEGSAIQQGWQGTRASR